MKILVQRTFALIVIRYRMVIKGIRQSGQVCRIRIRGQKCLNLLNGVVLLCRKPKSQLLLSHGVVQTLKPQHEVHHTLPKPPVAFAGVASPWQLKGCLVGPALNIASQLATYRVISILYSIFASVKEMVHRFT
jgi:hypothetical protein